MIIDYKTFSGEKNYKRRMVSVETLLLLSTYTTIPPTMARSPDPIFRAAVARRE